MLHGTQTVCLFWNDIGLHRWMLSSVLICEDASPPQSPYFCEKKMASLYTTKVVVKINKIQIFPFGFYSGISMTDKLSYITKFGWIICLHKYAYLIFLHYCSRKLVKGAMGSLKVSMTDTRPLMQLCFLNRLMPHHHATLLSSLVTLIGWIVFKKATQYWLERLCFTFALGRGLLLRGFVCF